MKNKKLLAMALLPLGLTQTVSALFTTHETKHIISELLTYEKVTEQRRVSERKNLEFKLKK